MSQLNYFAQKFLSFLI